MMSKKVVKITCIVIAAVMAATILIGAVALFMG